MSFWTCTAYHWGKWSQWFSYDRTPCPIHGKEFLRKV